MAVGTSRGRGRRSGGKGGHRRKVKGHVATTLTQEDIEYLKKNTRYDEQEIKEWFKGFRVRSQEAYLAGPSTNTDSTFFQTDCPDGQLSKTKILDMYSLILPAGNAHVFVDQIFRIFDKDGNGSIDFKVRSIRYRMCVSNSTLVVKFGVQLTSLRKSRKAGKKKK